jgi:Ca-activated chloride channel family protein
VRIRTRGELAALILIVLGLSPWTPGQSVSETTPPSPLGELQDRSQPAHQPENNSETFVFHKRVEEVVLHATVLDEKQRLVTTLDRGSFSVYEDGKPQSITSFRKEDIPVSMGIVIDNSGSMREKRNRVNQAALNLVRASNPRDEVFIVNFNDEHYLDQAFTNNLSKLKEALEKYETRGGTALYDAVVASADYLKKNAQLEKKVLFVATDGDDNASTEPLQKAVAKVGEENGPTIYCLGLLGEEKTRRAKRALQLLAEKTGGVSFFPKTLEEVDSISRTIAHDIRNQYTIGYKPSNPQNLGRYRRIKVEARATGYGKLQVRTRTGYYAGNNRTAREIPRPFPRCSAPIVNLAPFQHD